MPPRSASWVRSLRRSAVVEYRAVAAASASADSGSGLGSGAARFGGGDVLLGAIRRAMCTGWKAGRGRARRGPL